MPSKTPIGVDVGEKTLYTLCPIDLRDWRGAHVVHGGELCDRLDTLRAQTIALLASQYDRDTIAAYVEQRHAAIVETIDAAAHACCAYASAYDDPVLVTEDSHYQPRLWDWLTDPDAHRGSTWLLAAAHLRLRAIAAEYAIPVATVPEAYSTQACHACGVIGDRVVNAMVRCRNPDCHVDSVAADFNAAMVLARRYRSGRSCAYRPGRSPVVESDAGGGAGADAGGAGSGADDRATRSADDRPARTTDDRSARSANDRPTQPADEPLTRFADGGHAE